MAKPAFLNKGGKKAAKPNPFAGKESAKEERAEKGKMPMGKGKMPMAPQMGFKKGGKVGKGC